MLLVLRVQLVELDTVDVLMGPAMTVAQHTQPNQQAAAGGRQVMRR
jgi:hypothetical protein